jgi:preprotein translocase subunit SecF
MYIFGGQALRGFTFAIGLGVIVGTYSSIAIAAPALLIGTRIKTEKGK